MNTTIILNDNPLEGDIIIKPEDGERGTVVYDNLSLPYKYLIKEGDKLNYYKYEDLIKIFKPNDWTDAVNLISKYFKKGDMITVNDLYIFKYDNLVLPDEFAYFQLIHCRNIYVREKRILRFPEVSFPLENLMTIRLATKDEILDIMAKED